MNISMHNITIRDVVNGYQDKGEAGVTGYGGLLDIRPPYRLMADEDVTAKKGIYAYVLGGEKKEDERLLSIRKFLERDKRSAYEKQNDICPKCGNHFDMKDMQADHIIPWSKGGRTIAENCQMLCAKCNREKTND